MKTFLTWVVLGLVSIFSYEHFALASHVTNHLIDLGAMSLMGFAVGAVGLADHYVTQFANNIQLNLQQKGSRLRMAVTEAMYKGEKASPVDQVASVDMQPVTGVFEPIGRVDAVLTRRWVFPLAYDLNQLIDKFEKLELLLDPTSSFVQNAGNAAGRKIDDIIIANMFGTNYIGKAGTTQQAFGSNTVAVGFGAASDVSLTVAKLKEANRLLMAAECDMDEERYAAINALAFSNLLGEAQVTSTDFNERPVLVDGKLAKFLGINFIHSERLPTSSGDRLVPVWVKSGMHLGLWEDQITDISQRKDLQGHPWQAYVTLMAGATRLEENKLVKITCNE